MQRIRLPDFMINAAETQFCYYNCLLLISGILMKIKKVTILASDKIKAEKTAKRNAIVESGLDTRQKPYKNRKKYTRKGKHKSTGSNDEVLQELSVE